MAAFAIGSVMNTNQGPELTAASRLGETSDRALLDPPMIGADTPNIDVEPAAESPGRVEETRPGTDAPEADLTPAPTADVVDETAGETPTPRRGRGAARAVGTATDRSDRAPRPEAATPPPAVETRTIAASNERRAEVQVVLTCGSESRTAQVGPAATVSLRAPVEDCRVSCTGLGGPRCPLLLRSTQNRLVIR